MRTMKNKHSKIKIGLLSLLLLMLAAGTVLAIRGSGNTSTSAPGNTEADVNFSPPTEEDKKAVEDNKRHFNGFFEDRDPNY